MAQNKKYFCAIGNSVAGFRLSPESIMLNAKTLNTSSSDRGSMYLLASDTMMVQSVGTELTATGSQGGETIIATLNGALSMAGAIDAAGELVNLAGYDVDVRAAVRSPDGALNLTNLDTSGAMVFGANVNGQYSVDTSELGFLNPGFSAINIGSSYGSNQIAFGTDTGGSIRSPAAFNGVVGYKTSTGHYPMAGVFPLSRTLDTLGPLAHSVEDCVLADTVLRGLQAPEVHAAPVEALDFVVPDSVMLTGLSPAVAANFDATVARLDQAGARVRRIARRARPYS